ncbi:MAG: hypothetical protein GTO40_26230 [Deltaproteobacteria bacterium]|nr:hypothetical protein [Deltaproteobacteria bacterium]
MKKSGVVACKLFLLVLFLFASPALAYQETAVADGGSIVGKVMFKGTAPAPKKITVTRDKKVCDRETKYTESLLVSKNRGVKNVVVRLTDIKKGRKFEVPNSFEIDQGGCQFRPHVSIVQAGKPFVLINKDGILHNFRTTGTINPTLNKAQPKFKKRLKIKLDKPEILRVNCDVHEWMDGWLVVAAHPYYSLSDKSGAFEIVNVPPGTYTLEIWHETLGKQTQKVTVKAKKKTRVSLELAKK